MLDTRTFGFSSAHSNYLFGVVPSTLTLVMPAVVCCSFFRATTSISPDISHSCRWHRFFDQKIPKVWKWRSSSVLSSKTTHLSSKVFLSLQVDFYHISVWSCCTSISLKHAHWSQDRFFVLPRKLRECGFHASMLGDGNSKLDPMASVVATLVAMVLLGGFCCCFKWLWMPDVQVHFFRECDIVTELVCKCVGSLVWCSVLDCYCDACFLQLSAS